MRTASVSCLLSVAFLGHAIANVDTSGLSSGWSFRTYLVDSNECPNSIVNWDENDFHSEASGTVQTIDVSNTGSAWPSPYTVGSTDCFVTRHEGILAIQTAGRFMFKIGSNDGSILTIDGQVVSS